MDSIEKLIAATLHVVERESRSNATLLLKAAAAAAASVNYSKSEVALAVLEVTGNEKPDQEDSPHAE